MRNNGPLFLANAQQNQSLRQAMQRNYTDCISTLQTQWAQSDYDQRCCLGDADVYSQLFPTTNTRRKLFSFSLVNSLVQMATGYQRRNRKSTICIPIQSPMQKTSDQLTKCLYYVHNKSGAYQIYSDAFEQGALIQGLGLVSIFKDTTQDPISGDIRLRYVDFKSIIIDPFFRRHDLSDCRFIWTRQFFGTQDIIALYPELADQILALPKGQYMDDKFYYMPEVYQVQYPGMYAMDEYWYQSSRECTYLVDKQTDECQEFQGNEDSLDEIMRAFKNRLVVIKKPKPTTRRTILVNDQIMIDEQNPYGIDCYPYVPFLGYFTPDTMYYGYKFKGIVRDIRDVQYLFNIHKVNDLDQVMAQQQGLKVKQGSLVTPTDSLNQGNGRVLTIKKEASMDDVQPMPIVPPAPTLLQMEDMLKDIMYRITGISPEMMGQDVDDKAGIITMMRQSAGITTLTRLFDQFDESQRLCGDIILQMIQANWTYGKVKQVIGEEPTSEFDNKAFFKYGTKVVQGVLTESQQQLELAQILHLRELFGDLVPEDEIIEAMTIQNKERIIEKIEARRKEAAEQQQRLQKIQEQQIQVETATKLGYAHSQEALASERMAKIQLDKALNAERIQRAEEDRTGSVLNLVKAVKELQTIDLNQLQQALDIVESLKNNEGEEAEEKASQPITKSAPMSITPERSYGKEYVQSGV